ncbi:hypothetical protein GCM10023238_38770 [Streptomyces heliomycini]
MKDHQHTEELRLGYVTFTRPRSLLLGSGHWWGPSQKKPRGPSDFLHALHAHCAAGHGEIEAWADEPAEDEENPALHRGDDDQVWPLPSTPRPHPPPRGRRHRPRPPPPPRRRPGRPRHGRTRPDAHDDPDWPPPPDDEDPLPEEDPFAAAGPDDWDSWSTDRPTVPHQATPPETAAHPSTAEPDHPPRPRLTPEEARTVASWTATSTALTGELLHTRASVTEVRLPASLTASELLRLAADRTASPGNWPAPCPPPTARRAPRHPLPRLDRARFEELTLPMLDPDELPGSDAEIADERDWRPSRRPSNAPSTPTAPPTGWKPPSSCRSPAASSAAASTPSTGRTTGTGRRTRSSTGDRPRPHRRPAPARVYRLAWAEQQGVPLESVTAAFLYVRTGEIVRPDPLPGRAELERLLLGEPSGEIPHSETPARADRLEDMSQPVDTAVSASVRTSHSTASPSSTTSPSGCASRPSRPSPTTRPTCAAAPTGSPPNSRRPASRPPRSGPPGAPAVYAEWPSADPEAPTVLVYGHHDVQPAAREDGWDSEPFEPVVRDDRLYARGAADDKGQVFFHTLGVRAHLAATGRTTPAVHLKLLIEGEEESGSPHFRALVEQHADRLTADAVIVSDTGMWSEDTPTVCTGMRGLAECEIRLHGPDQTSTPVPSGARCPTPATAVARLVAALHDEHARVAIPGFYDGVVELTDRERELFAELPFDERQWLRTAKSHGTRGEAGYSTLERVWARPTAEVNGIGGGYQGPGSKTIIPSSAMVKLSFRLVAGQDPERVREAVEAWVPGQLPDGIRHEISFSPATRPCLTPLDHTRPCGRGPRDGPRLRPARPLHPRGRLRTGRRPPGRPRRTVLFLGISVRPTAGTPPTRRSTWTCSSKASRPARTCGATSPSTGGTPPDLARRPNRTSARGTLEGTRRRAPQDPVPPAARPAEPPADPIRFTGGVGSTRDHLDRPHRRPSHLAHRPERIDRAAHHRLDEAWLAAAWSHPSTRCFVVSGGQVLIDETADGRTELVMTPSFEAPLTEAHRYFLGIDDEGVSYFALQKDSLPAAWTTPPARRACARRDCSCRSARPA